MDEFTCNCGRTLPAAHRCLRCGSEAAQPQEAPAPASVDEGKDKAAPKEG